MKMKTCFWILFLGFTTASFAQDRNTRDLLKEIEGQWALNESGNVEYQRIIEAPGVEQDEIFNRVLDFFLYYYSMGNSVVQTEDRVLNRIVGKGIFDDVHSTFFPNNYVDCRHNIAVDIKDGRARASLVLTEFENELIMDYSSIFQTFKVADSYPVNPDGKTKNKMGKAFYKSHFAALEALDALERSIKQGTYVDQRLKDEW